MKSIKARFEKIKDKNPNLGSCVVFAKAVRGQKFTQSAIAREFSKLVPNEEYVKSERKAILGFLVKVSNTTEDDKLEAKNAPGIAVRI